eukprot:6181821-Pleurochrysis_carterae.AAC.4
MTSTVSRYGGAMSRGAAARCVLRGLASHSKQIDETGSTNKLRESKTVRAQTVISKFGKLSKGWYIGTYSKYPQVERSRTSRGLILNYMLITNNQQVLISDCIQPKGVVEIRLPQPLVLPHFGTASAWFCLQASVACAAATARADSEMGRAPGLIPARLHARLHALCSLPRIHVHLSLPSVLDTNVLRCPELQLCRLLLFQLASLRMSSTQLATRPAAPLLHPSPPWLPLLFTQCPAATFACAAPSDMQANFCEVHRRAARPRRMQLEGHHKFVEVLPWHFSSRNLTITASSYVSNVTGVAHTHASFRAVNAACGVGSDENR